MKRKPLQLFERCSDLALGFAELSLAWRSVYGERRFLRFL